jgi:hypothetical protein
MLPLLSLVAHAVTPHRSFYDLPSSNGWGAVVVDLEGGRLHHWRDHLFATEEPQWDAAGNEVWVDGHPQTVFARDLMYDAYLGVRVDGDQRWLPGVPVDYDASGWMAWDPAEAPHGGTNVVEMVQTWGDLRFTHHIWAPTGLSRSAFAVVTTVENTGASPASDVVVFGLQNLHLGEGRPGPTTDIGAENETVVLHADGTVEERGFAGVAALVPLTPASSRSVWYPGAAWANPWEVVNAGGAADPAAQTGDQGVHTDTVSYLRWDLGDLPPGGTAHVGYVVGHDGDPFAFEAVRAELEAWAASASIESIA